MTREPFWYLATPYSKYDEGMEKAFEDAAKAAASLIKHGIRVFCPIAHTHPLSVHGDIDNEAGDLDFWLGVDGPMIDAAVGLIVVKMQGWDTSEGVEEEVRKFREESKPILYMEWET